MRREDRSTARVGAARLWSSVGLLAAVVLAGPIACRPEVDRPSLLIFLTVDTLRSDRLGAFGGDLGLTPNLDALAEESIVFTSTYAPTSFTLPSVSAMMTGRYPSELGIWLNESGLPDATPTLAGELKRRGWRTYAVVSNFVLRRGSGLDAGFDHYDDSFRDREIVRGLPERTAADTTDAGLAMIDLCSEGGDSRCLVWIHYQDPHGPYTAPEERRARYLPIERERTDGRRMLPVNPGTEGLGGIPQYQYIDEQREVAFYRAGYDAEVSYLDEQIGRLLAGLEERGLMHAALIAFAADHGESLGEGNYWFAHGDYLSEVLVRVPFFLRIPGRAPARRSDVVSLVDLYGTLLRQLTGESDVSEHRGRDLLAQAAEEGASVPYLDARGARKERRYGIVDGTHKWIVTERGEVSSGTLFQVGQDGRAVISEDPEIERRMSEQLDQLKRDLGGEAPEIRQPLSDADREALRALGYAEESPSVEEQAR
ncbi:MAG: sulfatase [Deltaproteobacteria bacterium]|jgi:arylsulfatase A-like enzyme|nr:sulfatase [Deltaproteobacteria bacterium]MBW2543282.1 sulfatase [Deltaproteobacteria bacterium]